MYRLVEENRNIERRLEIETSLCSPSTNSDRLAKAKQALTNKSPPRLPYDELQMDQRQQQRDRSKQLTIESPRLEHPPPLEYDTTPDPPLDNSYSSMDTSSHSTGSAKERLRSRIEMDGRRGRKSHPWETDVKINRFSSNATPAAASGGRPPLTSRTQQSTLGWKQRMQERRAVFGNVAVPEQSFDDDDGQYDEEDDDESRGENDEELIREEAVELLKSKGFHNFQGILEHQYDDDLESVGGSVKSASKNGPSFVSPPIRRRTINLGEIQSLRQKILLQQDTGDSCDALPEDEEDIPFDQQVQNVLRCSGVNLSTTATTTAPLPDPIVPEDNEDAVKAWKVMKELKVRLQDVFTDDYFILEAMGRKGVGSPSETKVVIDENAFSRHKMRDALEKRVSLVFTGDHHIVCNGDLDHDACSVIQESLSGDTGAYSSPNDKSDSSDFSEEEDKRESFKSPKLRERLSDSFVVFEAMLRSRQQQAALDAEEDSYTEVPVAEPSIRNQLDMLPSMPPTTHTNEDDDQSVYSEYTVDTSAFNTGNRNNIVSTATAANDEAYANVAGMDDSRQTIKANNTQAATLSSALEGYTTPKKPDAGDDDDESYAEYTVCDDVPVQQAPPPMPAPFRMPGQAQFPVQSLRKDSDDQSYMEFTVQDTAAADSPPTRLPPQRQRSDDESYMEVTIADQAYNPNVSMPQPPDLTSPHLTSMLSSRMFADMQLPPELQQQQPQQRGLADDQENYPTITIHQDDDDMTQITFEHTMDDMVSESPDHHHAAQYLETSFSSQNKEACQSSFNNADVTSVVGSLHTEQTRDTTVSEGSSTQEAASFKSCVSSESSQFVAEILRRDIWSPDDAVVQTALEKLEQEASKGFHARSNIVRYGGLLAVLRAMEMKPDKPQIQIAAFGALEQMAMDASTQVAIGEVGGIPAIANSMRGHVANINVQQAACKALSNLTKHRDGGSLLSQDPVHTEGVVETVTKAMTEHPEDAEIQAHAFGALANICLDDQARLRELKKSGGLASMTVALQVPWENQTEQNEAISTLSIMLRTMTLLDKK